VVSIAGAVQDRATRTRIGGARVEITEGPPAFQAMLAAQAADPAWQHRQERPDRTVSQSDGIFIFVDLPSGPYRLRVSAPEMGSRYGAVEVGPIEVQAVPAEGPFSAARADVDCRRRGFAELSPMQSLDGPFRPRASACSATRPS
jgi:hypothetical protein